MNTVERLDKLRLKLDLTWEELGRELELSRSMLHYLKKGERQLSARAFFRLCEAERAAGIEYPSKLNKALDQTGLSFGAKGITATLEKPPNLVDQVLLELGELKDRICSIEKKVKLLRK